MEVAGFKIAVFMCATGMLGVHAQTGANPQWDAMMEAGHFKRLRQIMDERLKANPNDGLAHLWQSKIKASFGDAAGALLSAERAVALEPKNAGTDAQLAEASAGLAGKTGPLTALGHVRRMKRELGAALAIDGNSLDALLVQMMFQWQAPAIAGGDRNRALQIAGRLVEILPVWGNLAHAKLLEESGDDATVEKWLQGAIRSDPKFLLPRISLGRFYCHTAKAKRLDRCEAAAEVVVKMSPGSAAGYELLAHVQATQQRWAELEATLAKAEKASAEDYAAYYAAGKALIEIGRDFRRAEQYLSHYLSNPPEGRKPTHAETRFLLATLYTKEGRKADAVRELSIALRLQPDYEAAKTELKRIRQG
jgi:tetratricopeptide (TPR) repeat protein